MMSRSGFLAGLVRGWLQLRGARGCVLLILIAALMPVAGRAQDVAEAARQEKARKAAQGARQSHVYTNEDLLKAEIVSREESAAVQARKKNSDGATENASVAINGATPATKPAANAPAVDAGEKIVASESLGEVARRYRREKAVRQAERASANLPASQFHLEVATPALAEVVPGRVLSGPAIASSLPATRNIQPKNSGIPAKRDPFLRPGLGRLEIANRPATNGSTTAIPTGLPDGTAKRIIAPNANNSADAVAEMTRTSAPPTIAKGISIPSRLGSRPVAAPSADNSVVVRDGDSLWRISRQYSGAGARWREWLAANSGIDEKRLRPGMTLIVPSRGKSEAWQQKAPASEGGRYETLPGVAGGPITVRAGDSFWKIAAERYGDGRLWTCIARANAEWRDVEKIYPGQILMMPAACGK